MALGDGITWDETLPDDNVAISQGDDHILDLRKGVRSRMALEHEWPASQSATAPAGKHKFLTFQLQTAAPTLSGTQVAALYHGTQATTGDVLYFINTATQSIALSKKMYYWYFGGGIATGTKQGATLYLISDGRIALARGYCTTTASGGDGIQVDVNYNGSSIWTATANQIILAPGSTSTSVASFVTTNVTAGGTFQIDIDKVGTGTAGGNVTVMVEVW